MKSAQRLALAALAVAGTLPVLAEDQPLRALATARGIDIGAAVAIRPLRDDAEYAALLGREFGMVVGENAFKWNALHPFTSRYYFGDTDEIVAFAEVNGMKVRGHTLVWHQQNPTWLARKTKTRDDAIAALKDHIDTVVGRYKGRIVAWDVVNEAVDDTTGELRESPWLTAIGPDYIALAFQFAFRTADLPLLQRSPRRTLDRALHRGHESEHGQHRPEDFWKLKKK